MEKYRKYLVKKGLAENTVKSYVWTAEQFRATYGKPTLKKVLAYKESLTLRYRPQTVNLRLIALGRYFDYMGLADMKPRIVRITRKSFLENVISDADYRYFKKCLRRDGLVLWYFLVWFLAATGARVSELRQVKAEHIGQGYLDIYSKGGKIRRLYIPKLLRAEATGWLNERGMESGYIFTNRFGGRLTTRGIAQQLKRYGRKYGLDASVVYPHSFRHLFARNFLDRHKDIAMLADLMGHESIETTRIYLRRTACEQQRVVDRIVDW